MSPLKTDITRLKFTFNHALLLLLLALFLGVALVNHTLFDPQYLFGVMLRNVVEIGMLAFALTLIILTGGIDLSVGSTLVLSSMVGGILAARTGSSALGVLATLITGASCGFFNAFLVVKFRISPLIATLATMYLFMGLARGLSKGDSVYSYAATKALGKTDFGFLPAQLLIFAVCAAVFCLVQEKTVLGRYLAGIGLNEEAVRYSGVDTARVKYVIYIVSGLMAALASLIWLGRFSSIKYDAGVSLNLRAITVVVLGGTSILGGVGHMSGTVMATLIVAVLNSGLTLLNIPIDAQTIVQGLVLIISLIAYAYLNERAKRRRAIKPGRERASSV